MKRVDKESKVIIFVKEQSNYLKMAFERISRKFKEIRMPPLTRHSLQEKFWVLIEVESVRILRLKVVTHSLCP